MFSGSGSIKAIRVRKQRYCDFQSGRQTVRFLQISIFGVHLPLESEVSGGGAEKPFHRHGI
jgi:hypothetical protein